MQVGVANIKKYFSLEISILCMNCTPIPIFKYIIAVANDKEPLHNKSLVILYHFCPLPFLRLVKSLCLATLD